MGQYWSRNDLSKNVNNIEELRIMEKVILDTKYEKPD